jgi:uncharacterized protein (DUF1800 family)
MKHLLTRAGALAALTTASFALASGAPLGFDDARHLLNRTGFSATPGEIDAYAGLTREQAVDRLLAGAGRPAATPPPAWVTGFESPRRFRGMSAEERKLAVRDVFQKAFELQSWWLAEMLTTRSPLNERMTLFWHNHFVSSVRKVRSPQLMYRQNVLLRQHAFGNFGEMLRAVARDPAMVVYLDSASNRRGQPNENFAREVMELFTLGEGNYTEHDIKEAARAFTGWSINIDTGDFVFRPMLHDGGTKTVLGRTGNLDGDAVLELLLAQPQTAEHLVAKLWREFVSLQPDPAEVRRIARLFRASHYDISAALRALLVADAFYARHNRAALIKSPVDIVVGTLRQFQFATGDVMPFVVATNQLGQALFAPPNVKGWAGGEAWINSTTLLARKTFLERLFRTEELRPMLATAMGRGDPMATAQQQQNRERFIRAMMEVQFDGGRWMGQFDGRDPDAMQRVVLAAAPVNEALLGLDRMDLIRQLTQDPVYQLK